MSERELREALERGAGTPDGRPPLDGLWGTGRAQRRRSRVLTGAAALVAVAVLAAGAVALATGGGSDEVVAGPADGPAGAAVPRPPAEPDLPVRLEVTTVGSVGDTPALTSGETFSLVVSGATGQRVPGFTWESWDGEGWTPVHGLLPGASEVTVGDVRSMSSTRPVPDEEPLVLVAPEAEPGWYRVCGDVMVEAEGATPVRWLATCTQVRVPVDDGGPPTTTGPVAPPPETQGSTADTLAPVVDGPAPPNTLLQLELTTPQGATLGGNTTWEQWDGAAWVPTHLYGDYLEPRPTLRFLIGTETPIPDVAHQVPAGARVLTLPVPNDIDLLSPWSRVCVDTSSGDDARPCVELEVERAPEEIAFGFGADDEPEPTHPATWVIDPASPPTAGSTSVDLLVTQEACSGEELLEPEVTGEDERITIRIDARRGSDLSCEGDRTEPVTVELDGPLGERRLLDGACARSDVRMIDACDDGAVRWPER